MSLEGGYVGEEVGECVVECVRVLLGDGVVLQDPAQLANSPAQQAIADIHTTINHQVNIQGIIS